MTIATLETVLNKARQDGIAIAGLVCLGWEDIGAFIAAAEQINVPIILQAGPGCRKHTPLRLLGPMFRYHAERASVPVICHLDHGYELDEVREAIDCGFSSVMIDGSQKPLSENIKITRAAVELGQKAGISVEGEIGFVGYDEGASSQGTDPEEARLLAQEAGLHALAISAGNTHLQTHAKANINVPLIEAIAAKVDVPLVLHGGSGIPADMRHHLASRQLVQKIQYRHRNQASFRQVITIISAR